MNRRQSIIIWTAILLAIVFILFLLWLFIWQYRKSTEDAYVNGNRVNVTSIVGGTPIAFFADSTDFVKEGEVLVLLDRTPYEIALNAELAQLATAAHKVSDIQATVMAKQSAKEKAEVALNQALYDLQNRKALIPSNAISGQDFIHSENNYQMAKAAFEEASSDLAKAKSLRGTGPIEQHPLLLHQMEACRKAFYNLAHTKIVAPVSGNIAQRSVEVGQWTSPSQFLMAIIPQESMWVDANFKETELTYMRVGQPAKVKIDLYGSKVTLEGKVQGISSGTGSVFSLIPPQNATGNWIKIVQRLPVRIALDPKQYKDFPLRLGLSTDVTVDITDQSLPYLVEVPTPPVAKARTSVYTIDFSPLEEKMKRIIQENLYDSKRQ